VVVAMDYRLAPKSPFPAARDDVLSAIAYLKVYASELNIDPTRIALIGRSAGAQLALLSAYTAHEPSIRGVVSLYGPSDLRFGYENPGPAKVSDTRAAIEAYLGGAPGSDTNKTYYAASPVNFVTPASPPSLLVHGERDPIISFNHASRLEERLLQAGVKHLVVRLPWATHACDKSFGGPCGQIVTYSVERFLDSVLAGPRPPKAAPSRGRTASLQTRTARKGD
jgi:acetyl esterase/lipase